mmetsp:Transcript_93/g.99  ORF Transcript_93/g.99 Transcript_93/m.99 type:complete len:555 (-) Transcript_93:214-1878(-)
MFEREGAQLKLEMKGVPDDLFKAFIDDLSFWGNLSPQIKRKPDRSKQDEIKRRERRGTPRLNRSASSNVKPIWRSAVDSVTGQTYYYDAITRRTQWEKPEEIRILERKQRQEKKKEDRVFFKQMENNIYQSLGKGQVIPGIQFKKLEWQPDEVEQEQPPPCRARTISGMDESLLQELNQTHNKKVSNSCVLRDAHGRPPLPDGRVYESQSSHDVSLELSPEECSRKSDGYLSNEDDHPLLHADADEFDYSLHGEKLLDGPIIDDADESMQFQSVETRRQVQHHIRRNTGATIYAESTMMNPDIEATIKCVCGVYREHIVQASSKRLNNSPVSVAFHGSSSNGDIFIDFPSPGNEIPSLENIIAFYQDFYVRSQMEHDTIIMSLIYIERLIKETSIVPVPENWQSVLFSCMVLASKVWDDLSMWNIDFSNVCGRGGGLLVVYTLPRINQLELALLKALNFNVKVPASEYAKYYFLIRSILIKSGLLTEEKQKTTSSQINNSACVPNGHRGTRSMSDYRWFEQQQQNKVGLQKQQQPISSRGSSVSLEQLLSMTTY